MNDEGAAPPRLAVFGAGVMGVGITTLALGHGLPVVLVDTDADKLSSAQERIQHELRLARLMGAFPGDSVDAELTPSTSASTAADVGFVVEAITEDGDLKTKAHQEIADITAPGVLRVTNTSSVPVDELAAAVPRPDHLVGIHFMNPPYLVGTVEVIRGSRTSDQAMSAVRTLTACLGRQPIVVGDGPGFVTSRVLHGMINQAVRVVEDGRAGPEEVDALMQGCLGHPTGPLRTADLIGIDNLVDSLRVLHERTGEEWYRPSTLLERKVADGDFGRKTGKGFYDYVEA